MMVKLIFFLFIHCLVIFIGNFSHDVNGLESSIFEVTNTGSGIRNEKNFGPEKMERGFTHFLPFDDVECSEERHKSKRCWRTRPMKKLSVTLDSRETEDADYRAIKLAKGLNLKEGRTTLDNGSTEENLDGSDSMNLKKQPQSDDYSFWALVGRKAGYPDGNKQSKYICYCREADCSDINCKKATLTDQYKPCLSCRYVRPGFVGKVKNNCQHEGEDYYKNHATISRDDQIASNIKYPGARNEFVQSSFRNPEISLPRNIMQNPTVYSNDRRQPFAFDNPKMILANPNKNGNPSEQYRIIHIPVYRMQNEKSGEKLATNFYYPPGRGMENANEYRSGNIKWNANTFYPIIGEPRNFDTINEDHRIIPQNFVQPYESNNGFIGSTIPISNQHIVPHHQPEVPSSLNSFYNEQQSGFNSHNPTVQSYRLPQHFQTQTKISNHQINSGYPAETTHWIGGDEKKNVEYDSKSEGYHMGEKYNIESSEILEKPKNMPSHDDYKIISEKSNYEDQTEEEKDTSEENYKNNVNGFSVSNEPEKYKFPIIYSKTMDSNEVTHDESNRLKYDDGLGINDHHLSADYTESSIQRGTEKWDEKNSFASLHDNEQSIPEIVESTYETLTENPNYHHQTSQSNEEVIPKAQLGNVENYNVDKTAELISNKKNDDEKINEFIESEKPVGDNYSGIKIVTNGYFTSEAYNDFGKGNDYVTPVFDGETGYDSEKTIGESNNEGPELRSENVIVKPDTQAADNYNGNKAFSSLETFTTVSSNIAKSLSVSDNRHPKDDGRGKIVAPDTSSPEKVHSPKTVSVFDDIESEIDDNNDDKQHSATSSSESDDQQVESDETIESTEEVIGEEEVNEGDVKEDDNHAPHVSSDQENVGKHSENEASNARSSNESGSHAEDIFIKQSMDGGSPAMSDEKKVKTAGDGIVEVTVHDNDVNQHKLNSYHSQVKNKLDDFRIENTPTKYFSPNDIVLDYIKKNGQDPVMLEESNKQIISKHPTADEKEIHHTEQGSQESEATLVKSSEDRKEFDDNKNINSAEQTSHDLKTNHEMPVQKVDTLVGNWQVSSEGYAPAIETIIHEEIRNENPLEKSKGIENTADKIKLLENDLIGEKKLTIQDHDDSREETYDSTEEIYETYESESEDEFREDGKLVGKTKESNEKFGKLNKSVDVQHSENFDQERTRSEYQYSTQSSTTFEDSTEANRDQSDEILSAVKCQQDQRKDILLDSHRLIGSQKLTTESYNEKILRGDFSIPARVTETILLDPEDDYSINENVQSKKTFEKTCNTPCYEKNLDLEQEVEYAEKKYPSKPDVAVALVPPSSEIYNPTHSHSEIDNNLSEGVRIIDFVGNTKNTVSCTKPPEVEDDPGYLGRLAPKKLIPDIESVVDLIDSDLTYIGDGVRLPLTIRRLKDGSFALSISAKFCKERTYEKCPCCVPRKGEILQEKRSIKNDNPEKTVTSSLHRRAIPDDKNTDDIDHQSKRTTRSISMPVDEFAEKYNLILTVSDQRPDFAAVELTPLENVLQDPLVQKLKSINEVPENERASILLLALQELYAKEPTDNETKKRKTPLVKTAKNHYVEDELKFETARYGYQKDNPILERIRIIKELQKESARKCERKYQKDCDDAITQKTELLTMILNWLKDVANSTPN